MATRRPKKVSRRQAVAVLGTSLVGGAVATTACTPPQQVASPCQAPAETVATKCGEVSSAVYTTPRVNESYLRGDGCCDYFRIALNHGYQNMAHPHQLHLKKFMDDLQSSRPQLMDYCFVVFGVKEEVANKMRENLKALLDNL